MKHICNTFNNDLNKNFILKILFPLVSRILFHQTTTLIRVPLPVSFALTIVTLDWDYIYKLSLNSNKIKLQTELML